MTQRKNSSRAVALNIFAFIYNLCIDLSFGFTLSSDKKEEKNQFIILIIFFLKLIKIFPSINIYILMNLN